MRLFLARHRRPLAVGTTLLGLWLTIRSAAPDPAATGPVLVAAHDLAAGHTITEADLRLAAWPATAIPKGRVTSAVGQVLASPVRGGEPVTNARILGPGLLTGQSAGMVAASVRLSDPAAGVMVQPGDRVDVLVTQTSWSAAGLADAGSGGDAAPDLQDGTGPATGMVGGNASTDAGATGASASPSASSGPGEVDTASGRTAAERVTESALVLAVPGDPGASGDQGGESGGSGLSGLTGGSVSSADGSSSSLAGVIVLAVEPADARRLAAAQASGQVSIDVVRGA